MIRNDFVSGGGPSAPPREARSVAAFPLIGFSPRLSPPGPLLPVSAGFYHQFPSARTLSTLGSTVYRSPQTFVCVCAPMGATYDGECTDGERTEGEHAEGVHGGEARSKQRCWKTLARTQPHCRRFAWQRNKWSRVNIEINTDVHPKQIGGLVISRPGAASARSCTSVYNASTHCKPPLIGNIPGR